MSSTRFGSFEDLLSITEDTLRPIVLKLREIILGIDPDVCEVVRLGDRSATYGIGPKKMKEGYAYILPYKSWVNLGFYQGAHLTDPENLLKGTGKNMRHIKLRTVEELNSPAIKRLIEEAQKERLNSVS